MSAAAQRITAVRELRSASPVTRLLVLTQLAFNVGFFMVLPYLSVYGARPRAGRVGGRPRPRASHLQPTGPVRCRGDARRPLRRQAGGADRLRAARRWLSRAGDVVLGRRGPGLDRAGGFPAALFSPAVEAALAQEAGEVERLGGPSRVPAFALFSVGGQIGAFVGPLVGALLLLVNFTAACLVAAGVFVLVLAAQVRWLPAHPATHAGEPVLRGWRDVLANRLFLLFALAYSGQLDRGPRDRRPGHAAAAPAGAT